MNAPRQYRLKLGRSEFAPLMIGGMGVDISTSAMVLEAVRLGCIAHLSDAMIPAVCDKRFDTHFTKNKIAHIRELQSETGSISVPSFDLDDYRQAQMKYVGDTVAKKQGTGAVFVNCMEKLQIGATLEMLKTRLTASLDAGADGITLSAGLHGHSMRLMSEHPRFRDAKIGIVVSSWRALRIFLKSAVKLDRLPDYVVVEGPLAGGHLGFGENWAEFNLRDIVLDVFQNLKKENLNIPVIPAGGIFDADDVLSFLEIGAAGIQAATRFTVTKESGFSDKAKQAYFDAEESEVLVSSISPTGYPFRLLTTSPCLNSNIPPQCQSLGYAIDPKGRCQYIDAYNAAGTSEDGKKLPVVEKMCLCHHMKQYDAWTCGSTVVRLKNTAAKDANGMYIQPTTEQVIDDYLGA